jgi:proteasome lid subunit RPN8/RPN11
MSIMGEAFTHWREPDVSIMCDSVICSRLPSGTVDAMKQITRESTDENREMGAAILPGYEMGEVNTGTGKSVAIKRPPNTIGLFHTHPRGLPVPSSQDILEMMNRNDKINCVGTSSSYGEKIACYTPNDSAWDETRQQVRNLRGEISKWNVAAHPYLGYVWEKNPDTDKWENTGRRSRPRPVPIRRLLHYVGSPAYIEDARKITVESKPESLRKFDDALDREYQHRQDVDIARRKVTEQELLVSNAQTKYNLAKYKIGYPPPDLKDAEIALRQAQEELERLQQITVVERRMLDDSIFDAEKARMSATAEPGAIQEAQDNQKRALEIINQGHQLEQKRQRILDKIRDDIRYTGLETEWYKPVSKNSTIDRCRVVWEGGLWGEGEFRNGQHVAVKNKSLAGIVLATTPMGDVLIRPDNGTADAWFNEIQLEYD